ncbi:unnamed protein product [Aphis gossypii]|uniref:Uncharacterized protein n=1 Tax=Aphis gossypii TaxID=80765 RepID=A0A9P0ITH2_APHGO|nr:unnamed protein product [Aphis gossypii]
MSRGVGRFKRFGAVTTEFVNKRIIIKRRRSTCAIGSAVLSLQRTCLCETFQSASGSVPVSRSCGSTVIAAAVVVVVVNNCSSGNDSSSNRGSSSSSSNSSTGMRCKSGKSHGRLHARVGGLQYYTKPSKTLSPGTSSQPTRVPTNPRTAGTDNDIAGERT